MQKSSLNNRNGCPTFKGALHLLAAGLAIPAMVLGVLYFHRAWAYIQDGGVACTTPGKAVGFLFIPLFNLYWIFQSYWGWSKDYNHYCASKAGFEDAPRAWEGLFLTFCILGVISAVPILQWIGMLIYPIIGMIVMSNLCKAVNFLHKSAEQCGAPQVRPR